MMKNKYLIIIGIIILAGLAVIWQAKQMEVAQHQEITIVAVTPNLVTSHSPIKECHQVTFHKKVKNKDSNFFKRVFNSKKHPEYILVKESREVCNSILQESTIQQGYLVKYQFHDVIESTIVNLAPAVNSHMDLDELEKYQPLLAKDVPGVVTKQSSSAAI